MTFVLRTPEGEDVGVLLFADEEGETGDCILRAFPPTPLPVSDFLFELQELGEFHWRLNGKGFEIFYPDHQPLGQIEDGRFSVGGYSLQAVPMSAA